MSSGTFLVELQSARADECEKMSGACEAASAARIVFTDTWDRSTIIPSRFISFTMLCNTQQTRFQN
jgi:hypothetical protein